jgi:hypothetical protein
VERREAAAGWDGWWEASRPAAGADVDDLAVRVEVPPTAPPHADVPAVRDFEALSRRVAA